MQNNMIKKYCIMIAGFLLIDFICWITRFLDTGSIKFIIVLQLMLFLFSVYRGHYTIRNK